LKTGLNRKLRIKSECNLPKNEVWVNSHLPVDATYSDFVPKNEYLEEKFANSLKEKDEHCYNLIKEL
jgi:hypothetical protein